MSDSYIVKVQTDITGQQVYIYSEKRDVDVIVRDSEAKRIIDCYGLAALEKIFVHSEVDEHGLLHLGLELEEQFW